MQTQCQATTTCKKLNCFHADYLTVIALDSKRQLNAFAYFNIEQDFDVVAGVPVAVVIKAAGLFEDAGELDAARAHIVNVSLGVLVAVFKGALLPGLAPKDFVVAVGIEGRVNVNEVNAGVGQLGELFQIVAAINDAGVEGG